MSKITTSGEFLTIDQENDIKRLIDKLTEIESELSNEDALRTTLNSAAKLTKKQMLADAKELYALTDESGYKKVTLKTASVTNLTATIQVRGAMQNITNFQYSPNTATKAVSVKILNQKSLKELKTGNKKAFMVKFKNGYTTVAERTTDASYPVKTLYALSIKHIMENETIQENANKATFEYMQEIVAQKIKKAAKGT